MTLINVSNWQLKYKQVEVTVEEIFNLLTDKDTDFDAEAPNVDKIAYIVSWLPSINTISVYTSVENCYLVVRLNNGEEIKVLNTGYEQALSEFFN